MSEGKIPARENLQEKKEQLLVIGIGASAGGLEALQQFFRNMPGSSGLCFVVIQHLSPDYKSLMADILGKHTEMTVTPGRERDGDLSGYRLSHSA